MGGANAKKKKSPRDEKNEKKKKNGNDGGNGSNDDEQMMVRGKKSGSKSTQATKTAQTDIQEKIDEALMDISYDRIEKGLGILKELCQKNETNVDVVETCAYAMAEYGDQEEALDYLRDAAKLNPEKGYEKFMYLGQLLDDGTAATACTKKGLELLEEQIKGGDASVADRHCAACCALAEQILGCRDLDLFSEEDLKAEGFNSVNDETAKAVELLLERAIKSDAESAEPLQVMACLRNEQGKKDEALKFLKLSIKKWRKAMPLVIQTKKEKEIYERKRPEHGADDYMSEDDEEEEAEEEENKNWRFQDYEVSFEFRFETAKLLLEIDTSTELAIEILEELLEERDGVVDVWYLLAYAHYGANDFDDSLEIIEIGEKLASKQREIGAMQEDESNSALMNFAELKSVIEEVKKEIAEAPAKA